MLSVLVQLRDGLMLLYHMMLLLPASLSGQLQVIGPSRPIVATVGDDITLPCHLEPARDASGLRLEWARSDLSPGFVHVRANSRELVDTKQLSYRGRTAVLGDGLKLGDVSLRISTVNVSDGGTYRCLLPTLGRAAVIELVVGAASSPVVSRVNRASSRVVLRCQSSGWRPQPELSWLDSEGRVLPAGPTQTLRGPGDLYSVTSTVIVDKRNGNRFTCRVQQKTINQMRETHVQLPAHPNTSSDYTWLWALCAVSVGFILYFVCIAMKILIKYCTRRDQRPEAWTRDQDQYRVKLVAKETAETITAQGNTKENEGEDHHMLNGEKVHIPLKASNMNGKGKNGV